MGLQVPVGAVFPHTKYKSSSFILESSLLIAVVSGAVRESQRSTKVPWQCKGQRGFVAAQCCIFSATELAHPQLHSSECLWFPVLPELQHSSATAPVP